MQQGARSVQRDGDSFLQNEGTKLTSERYTLIREICENHSSTPTFHNLQIPGVCRACHRKGEQHDPQDRVTHIEIRRNSLRK